MKNKISCKNCAGKCNKKGYPSVMKGSHYCKCQRHKEEVVYIGFWKKLKKSIKDIQKGFRK